MMKAYVHKVYVIIGFLFAMLFLYMFGLSDISITGYQPKENYEILTDYEMIIEQDETAPTGIRRIYTFTLSGIEESYCELVFYCIHQNAKVYVEDECVYSMVPSYTGLSGKSPGYVWNRLPFSEEDNGKKVTLEIIPVYSSSNDITPVLYFGNRYDIARDIIIEALPTLIFSVVVIVVGLIYICFVIYNNRKTNGENSLSMLGLLSIQLGLWRISESEAINLLFPGTPALSQLTFVMLMFMCLSLVLYVKELYSTRDNLIWYVPCILGVTNMLLTVLFQCLGVADMRQMLPITHGIMGIIVVITVIMTIYEMRCVGLNGRMKRNIRCLALCFVGVGIDMVVYYLTNGKAPSVFAMIGFLVYILVQGISSMQEIKELMKVGINAQKYEQLAYHDQLTGLHNRTAYEEYTNSEEFNPENCVVVVLDLNDLKSCNDAWGHDKGDVYIKEAAGIIEKVFGDIGHCYRMGGDEFHVLLQNVTPDVCRQRMDLLQEMVAECKEVGEDFQMGIACGFKVYDKSLDRNINETARRADKAMYQHKFDMKHEQ